MIEAFIEKHYVHFSKPFVSHCMAWSSVCSANTYEVRNSESDMKPLMHLRLIKITAKHVNITSLLLAEHCNNKSALMFPHQPHMVCLHHPEVNWEEGNTHIPVFGETVTLTIYGT